MFDIVQSKVESDITRDFVALGFLIVGKGGPHSAFVIRYQDTLYEFHYTGREIDFSTIWNDYYHKITNSVHQDEIPAFIAWCHQI